jgi:hypothetical protein
VIRWYSLADLDDLLPGLEPGEEPRAPDGVKQATDAEVAEFLDHYQAEEYPRALVRAVEGIDGTVYRQGGARHPSLRMFLWQSLAEAMVGAYSARQAVEEGYAHWKEHHVRPGERRPRNELPSLLRWQVPKVAARTDLADVRARLDKVFGEVTSNTGEQEPDEHGYVRVDLGPYLRGEVKRVKADLAVMNDGRGLLHRERLNGVHGDSGAGKSFLVAFTVRELAEAGRGVMVIDLEDTPDPLIERLRQIGLDDERIERLVVFVRPQEPFTPKNVERLIAMVQMDNVAHVFVETLGEAFSLEGLNEDRDVEVAPWLRRVCRRLIEQTQVGVTLIDHGTKSTDRPLDPSGSKRKRAAITGTAWLMQSVDPFDRGSGGLSTLTCAKDRHGWFKRGEQAARLVLDPQDPISGQSSLRLESVAGLMASRAAASPDVDPVVQTLEKAHPEKLSQRQLIAEVRNAGHQWGDKRVIRAADQAVAKGLVRTSSGRRGATLYEAIMPSVVP